MVPHRGHNFPLLLVVDCSVFRPGEGCSIQDDMLLFCMHAPQLRCTTIFVRTDYKHDSIAASLTAVINNR